MSSSNCKSWDGKAEKENKALQGHSDPPLIRAANVLITKTDTHRFPTLRVKREASLCHLYFLDHISVLFLTSSIAPSPLQCLRSNLLIHQPEKYNLVPQLSQLSGYHGNAALPTSVLWPMSALAGGAFTNPLCYLCPIWGPRPGSNLTAPMWGALLWPPRSILRPLPCPALCPRGLISRDHTI